MATYDEIDDKFCQCSQCVCQHQWVIYESDQMEVFPERQYKGSWLTNHSYKYVTKSLICAKCNKIKEVKKRDAEIFNMNNWAIKLTGFKEDTFDKDQKEVIVPFGDSYELTFSLPSGTLLRIE